jgi:hypothetical protein
MRKVQYRNNLARCHLGGLLAPFDCAAYRAEQSAIATFMIVMPQRHKRLRLTL